jgi:hypothetical protein
LPSTREDTLETQLLCAFSMTLDQLAARSCEY